jgi:hypothetical protein
VNYSTFSSNSKYHIYVNQVAHTPVVISNNIFDNPTETQHIFLHAAAEADSYIYNNLFSDDANLVYVCTRVQGGRCTQVKRVFGAAEDLNGVSWASENTRINPQLTNTGANNLTPRATSRAVDAALDFPLPEPRPAANPEMCVDDVDCINANAQEAKWNLDAYICDGGQCTVDVVADTDGDGFPDWIEIVMAGFLYNDNPAQIQSNYTPELDRTDTPSPYQPLYDMDAFPRPSGPARDQGAYEFTQ